MRKERGWRREERQERGSRDQQPGTRTVQNWRKAREDKRENKRAAVAAI